MSLLSLRDKSISLIEVGIIRDNLPQIKHLFNGFHYDNNDIGDVINCIISAINSLCHQWFSESFKYLITESYQIIFLKLEHGFKDFCAYAVLKKRKRLTNKFIVKRFTPLLRKLLILFAEEYYFINSCEVSRYENFEPIIENCFKNYVRNEHKALIS